MRFGWPARARPDVLPLHRRTAAADFAYSRQFPAIRPRFAADWWGGAARSMIRFPCKPRFPSSAPAPGAPPSPCCWQATRVIASSSGAREETGRVLRERRENTRLLPGVPIPRAWSLRQTSLMRLKAPTYWWRPCPPCYLRETLTRRRPHLRSGAPILSLAKGLEIDTFLRPTRNPDGDSRRRARRGAERP